MLAGSTQAFILDYILHLGKWRVCYSCPRALFNVRPPSRKKEKSSPQTSLLNIITPIIQIPHVPLVWRRGRSGKSECSHETDLPVRVKGWEGKDPFALHWNAWKLCIDHECLKSVCTKEENRLDVLLNDTQTSNSKQQAPAARLTERVMIPLLDLVSWSHKASHLERQNYTE